MRHEDQDRAYTDRLIKLQLAGWKQVFNVQGPYRWNLRRLHLGFTLEVGCGIGRNLRHLSPNIVGIDTNCHSVAYAKAQGLQAYTPDDFRDSPFNVPERFDSLLLSHVAEHLTFDALVRLLGDYDHLVERGGKLVLITPQEAGFSKDSTHVEFMDLEKLASAARLAGFQPDRGFSFPFPRVFGRLFTYNEFVLVSCKP